jgi:uncharacterized protein (DUF1330 family)
MAAYVINDMQVTDPTMLEEYKAISPATVAQYGGKFLARGGPCEMIEGEWIPQRLVILEFPDLQSAHAWLESSEYAPARRLRQLASKSNLVVVEGL